MQVIRLPLPADALEKRVQAGVRELIPPGHTIEGRGGGGQGGLASGTRESRASAGSTTDENPALSLESADTLVSLSDVC